MNRLSILFASLLLSWGSWGCSGQRPLIAQHRPLSLRMAESEIRRNPSPSRLDGIPEGKIKWNYTTGLELLAMMDAGRAYARDDFYDYALRYYDTIVRPDGSVITYDKAKYNLDHICPGRPLFEIYRRTGEPRYLAVLDTLYAQLQSQPRTSDGGFWHKKVYPWQMWLDGLYMAEPFYAEYIDRMKRTRSADCREQEADIVRQFVLVSEHTYDPHTRLFRHAWDESREMFWCDRQTGQSAHAWCRAMGWYAMALVETLDYLTPGAGRDELLAILKHIYDVLPEYADPATGMWYQVLDAPAREGNYLESTGSAMFVYAQLKAVRRGWLPASMRKEAMRRYEQLVERFIRENPDGTLSLTDCCAVAGLGGKQRRSGTFDYYISEPVIDNDCKGVGPFIWASLEYERLKGWIADEAGD